ncbi:MAG: hypothetical protein KJZ69_12880 [Phycisphaerales bacterium]|nr:hypothetical protein [Phycisphaerales bacterium]
MIPIRHIIAPALGATLALCACQSSPQPPRDVQVRITDGDRGRAVEVSDARGLGRVRVEQPPDANNAPRTPAASEQADLQRLEHENRDLTSSAQRLKAERDAAVAQAQRTAEQERVASARADAAEQRASELQRALDSRGVDFVALKTRMEEEGSAAQKREAGLLEELKTARSGEAAARLESEQRRQVSDDQAAQIRMLTDEVGAARRATEDAVERQRVESAKEHADLQAALKQARTENGRLRENEAKFTEEIGRLQRDNDSLRKSTTVKPEPDRSATQGAPQPALPAEPGSGGRDDGAATGAGPFWPAVGVAVALVAAATAVVAFMSRRPRAHVFTLLDAETKAGHRFKLTGAERVDLPGTEPVKRKRASSRHAPWLIVDRHARHMLHGAPGFVVEVIEPSANGTSQAPRSVASDQQTVIPPGSEIRVSGSGGTSRLVVGPASAFKEAQGAAAIIAPVTTARMT